MFYNIFTMIVRNKYINKINDFVDNTDFIKVLIGMRRVGKSTIMSQIANELIEKGIDEKRIISINFESLKFVELVDYLKLNEYIEERIKSKKTHYIFIDEIQNVPGFEKVVNSLKVEHNVSIFISGSNSNLLSGELATLLAGRYVSFNVYPLTYNEWMELKGIKKSSNESMNLYLKQGGLPQIAKLDSDIEFLNSTLDILNSIIYKDIMSRANLKNEILLKSIINYIIKNTSKQVSIKSLANYINTNSIKTKEDTVSEYLSHITNSMLVNECKKYNVKGKRELSKVNKLYLNNLGFRTVISNDGESGDFGFLIETAVFNHLKANDYELFTVDNNGLEIDFLAKKLTPDGWVNKYIQVSYMMSHDEKTKEREFRSLQSLPDNYEKFVISMDVENMSSDGIKHITLEKFLTNDEF